MRFLMLSVLFISCSKYQIKQEISKENQYYYVITNVFKGDSLICVHKEYSDVSKIDSIKKIYKKQYEFIYNGK